MFERGAVELVPGLVLLAGGVFGLQGEAGAVDHGGEGEALDDQGEHHDGGGEHQHEGPPGERAAVAVEQRDRQRGGGRAR